MLTGPIRFKRASAARWTTVNPVLLSGQPGFETDTGKQKIGNGITAWNDLPYTGEGAASAVESVNGKTGVVVLDKSDIGLSNVDNTSDVNKPISSATQSALDNKQPLATVLTNTTASFTTAQETKLAGIEAGADVTDATNVAAAGAVMESDYTPAHSLLVQQSGTGSPSSLSVPNNRLIGRLSGGGSNIGALTAAEVKTLLALAIADVSGLQAALDDKVSNTKSITNAIIFG